MQLNYMVFQIVHFMIEYQARFYVHGQKPRHQRYFSAAEENEMVNFFVEVAKAGYGKTITQV